MGLDKFKKLYYIDNMKIEKARQGAKQKQKPKGGGVMKSIREDLKNFIVEKVKQEVNTDRPYYFVRWSGLYELCGAYSLDLLELIDELVKEKRLKKALIKGKLAVTLPNIPLGKQNKLMKEFQEFLKSK